MDDKDGWVDRRAFHGEEEPPLDLSDATDDGGDDEVDCI